MRINYLLLVHETLGFKRLVDALIGDHVFVYVHVDLKKDIRLFQNLVEEYQEVYFIQNRVNVYWGGISMVTATIALMKAVQDSGCQRSYSVLMSGHDYPLVSHHKIVDFFNQDDGSMYISYEPVETAWDKSVVQKRLYSYNVHPFEYKRYVATLTLKHQNLGAFLKAILSCILRLKVKVFTKVFRKRVFPEKLIPYGGSQWWALPYDAIVKILSFLEDHPQYYIYHQYTHCADEIFFHSIIASIFPKKKIKPSVTYVNWFRKACDLPVVFSHTDYKELDESGCLFARKFHPSTSEEILRKLDLKRIKE